MNLFEPIVAENLWHPHFRTMLEDGNGFRMDVLNEWAHGFADRDGKFVREFQTTFNTCFWELYIFAVLKKMGKDVDFSKVRPDFCVPKLNLNIEATVALHAHHAEPEHMAFGKLPPSDLNKFNFQTIIRLSNSLRAKHRKYIESYALLDHVKDSAYVVGVTNFDQPFSFMACQRPIDAVLFGYYVDEEKFIASGMKEGKLVGEELSEVFKDNGSPVALGMFNTPEFKEISAVIFSACANMGKVIAMSSDPNPTIFINATRLNTSSSIPHQIGCLKNKYEEHLFDGLRVYHNPFALHPLDPALFRHRSIFQSYFKDDDWVHEFRDGQLLCRSTMTLTPFSDCYPTRKE